jgi:glycosyltransferase involved in cell wall biosynthesis
MVQNKSMSNSGQRPVWVQTATNVNMILNFGRNLTEIIKQSEIDYHVIYSKEQNKSNEAVIADELKNLNATLHVIPMTQQLDLKSLLGILVTFTKIFILLRRLKPDVFYTRGTLMGMVGRPAAYLANVKGIFHHQDDFYHREDTLSHFKKKAYRRIETMLARITTKLFFVSQAIHNEALAMGIPADKCVNVGHDLHPIFVEHLEKATALADSIRQAVRRPGDDFIVGVLGRIENFKGIDTVLAVAKQLSIREPRIQFFIRGIGSRYEQVREQIERDGLSATVRLTKEYFPTEAMPDLYRTFDVFFLPTRREGFGMVFAEAMSMGVPVVCPRIYPVVEVVPEDMGCLVDAEDVEAYVEAILQLYMDGDRRQQLAEAARVYAIDRWAGRESAQKVFNELCGIEAGS